MPLGDIFMSTFDITTGQYALLVSAFALAAFVSSILGMFYMDFFDRKKILMYVYLGFSVATFVCGLCDSYKFLLALRFMTGLFGGIIGAIVLSIVSDLYKFKERGRAMGIIMAAFSAASAIGVPFGLYLADLSSWKTPFFFLGIFGFMILGLIYYYFPSMTGHLKELDRNRKPMQTIKLITNDQNQLSALGTIFVLVLGHFLIIPFIAPFSVRNIGLAQDQVKFIFLFGGIATIFSARYIGSLTDKYGVMPTLKCIMLISFIPMVVITNMTYAPIWYALIFTTFFFVFGSGRMIPPNTIITAAASPENRGSFMSMRSGIAQLGIGTASFISGLVVRESNDPSGQFINYPYLAYISIFVCLIGLYLTSRLSVAKGN